MMGEDKKMELSLILFKEVNYQLKDLRFFDKIDVSSETLLYSIDFNFRYSREDVYEVFFHFEYAHRLTPDKKKVKKIFHGDYLSVFKLVLEGGHKEFENKILIDEENLAIILGITISTVRGYLLAMSRGSIISRYPIPIVNPKNLLSKSDLEFKDGAYFVEIKDEEESLS